MKVGSRTQIGTSGSAPRAGKSSASGAVFQPSGASDAAPARAAAGSGPLAALDALLAVQGADTVGDFKGGKRRAVARGEEILDILDEIKLGLLSGQVPGPKLTRLLSIVERQRDQVADPQLCEVLDHIELRARVELAKFGR
ncbi:flagellar assembly regulator FliX [Tepidicaulis marinus]|uniref:Flagellar assembly regulator FliX n=1 Tax=Tepidicaulis marinus TaxID=1333998 RepID=A0A081B9M1_9HYPH|nr:flagellar assembly protein FliX [Tepidicaulis marinus]GAK44739.1 flagellar assembly regulator FliX [Tepidicaulis marinus]